MNCMECQETMAADLEGVLHPELADEYQNHLAQCPACQSEQAQIVEMRGQLLAHGELGASAAFGPAVMGRIRRQQTEAPLALQAFWRKVRWALGCGAATAAVLLGLLLISPNGKANAAEVMTRGVKAALGLTSIHLQGRIRSAPAENFANVSAKSDFTSIELWKELQGPARWRIDKPSRTVVMDGKSTTHFMPLLKTVTRVPAVPATSIPTPSGTSLNGRSVPEGWAPFDTGWLHSIANIEQTLESELRRAQSKGWKMSITSETRQDGGVQAVVSIEATSGLPAGDYLQNKFFDTSDTRRVYRFDDLTGRLEGIQVYLHDPAGDILIFEVTAIHYNEIFGPEIFVLDLPADAVIQGDKPLLAGDNAGYAGLTAEQAARRFFEACGREDWNEVKAFWPLPLDERIKGYLGGIKLINIGQSFTSAAYPGRFVPYEIELRDGQAKKFNLALKQNRSTGRWHVDGGL